VRHCADLYRKEKCSAVECVIMDVMMKGHKDVLGLW
jgi:hypothetical protein